MRWLGWFALSVTTCLSCGAPPAIRAPANKLAASNVVAPAPPTPRADVASTRPVGEFDAKIDALFSAQSKPGRPGCAVGVYRAGEVVLSRGYGLANLEHGLPLGGDSVFDIASISKQFTAMAILLLEREGKLSREDDVRKYVPELPDYGHPIRLRHLLHHTSGVRDYIGLLQLAGLENDWVVDDDLLLLVHRQKALNFAPGTQWQYSNMGYFLLAVVVKRVSGMKFSAFAKERIFDPLGMKSTVVLDDHRAVVPGRATGYSAGKDGALRTAISRWEHAGPSRVATSVDDLARWDANFYEPRVGDRAIIESLRTRGTLDDGTPLDYALGLNVAPLKGRQAESHTGQTGGYVSDVIRYPAERLTVACLCNVEGDPETQPWLLAPAVAELLLPTGPAGEATTRSGVTGLGDVAPNKAKYEPSPSELEELVGSYYDPVTMMARTIAVEHGEVIVGMLPPNGPRATYVFEGPRNLVSSRSTTRLSFEPATRSTRARIVRRFEHEPPATLVRFEPEKLAPSVLDEYAGRYVSEEIPRELQITIVGGQVRIGTWGRVPAAEPLVVLTRDVLKTSDGGIRFERDAKQRVRGFVVSGNGFHEIRFTRR